MFDIGFKLSNILHKVRANIGESDFTYTCSIKIIKSVENAGVAFVKRANERNELLEKIEKKKQYCKTSSSDEQGKGLTISGTS